MKKILIIEDEVLIQQSLKKMLIRKGATVTTTADGKEAITLIHSNDYDRIICDLMLRDITGFDIIEDCKKKLSSEEIKSKFVIMTAYSSEHVIEKAKIYGSKILQKPFKNVQEAIEIMYDQDYEKEKN
jgi:CheY-like chemotaxis protein